MTVMGNSVPNLVSLPFDIARCVGRFGLGHGDPVCERRGRCARHLAMAADRERFKDGYPAYVSVATGLCRDGEDYMISVDPLEALHKAVGA